jgi:hypothetical protein
LGGYHLENWQELDADLRELLQLEAEPTGTGAYGQLYEICGNLHNLKVKTIWLWEHGENVHRFITMIPFP